MTNFEKIRSMDKTELAAVLKQFSEIDCDFYCENRPECDVIIGSPLTRPCEQCIENWLNKEVDENGMA